MHRIRPSTLTSVKYIPFTQTIGSRNVSNKMAKSFLVTKNMSHDYFAKLKDKFTMDMWPQPNDMSRSQLLERVKGKSAIFCTLVDKIDSELLDAAGTQLKTISTLSVGYDHIDIGECHKRGIVVGNTPDVLTDAVAELTIGLLLATLRRFFEAHKALLEKRWLPGWGHFFMCGGMVKDSVVGFVGAGRIGSSIMDRLKAFKPKQILYNTRTRQMPLEDEHGCRHVGLSDLLSQSDIVIVCCSLNPSTKHLLGREQFRLMKPNSILINTSRGAVVDQRALYEALKSGTTISAAGLDVMEVEPMPLDDPLLTLDNVVLLPHIGSASRTTREAMIHLAVDNLEAGLNGRPLPAAVRH